MVLGVSQIGLTITMLAYQTWLMSDAIVRTLVRVYVTHRGLLPSNGRRPRARRRRGNCRRVGATRGLARRAALRDAVDRVARGGSVDQRAAAHYEHSAALVRGCASAPIDRPSDVAVLRDVRRPRRPRVAARQLRGNAESGGGASNVAHEHRPVFAVHGNRTRFRLARHARRGRASRSHAWDDERPRALPDRKSTRLNSS